MDDPGRKPSRLTVWTALGAVGALIGFLASVKPALGQLRDIWQFFAGAGDSVLGAVALVGSRILVGAVAVLVAWVIWRIMRLGIGRLKRSLVAQRMLAALACLFLVGVMVYTIAPSVREDAETPSVDRGERSPSVEPEPDKDLSVDDGTEPTVDSSEADDDAERADPGRRARLRRATDRNRRVRRELGRELGGWAAFGCPPAVKHQLRSDFRTLVRAIRQHPTGSRNRKARHRAQRWIRWSRSTRARLNSGATGFTFINI